MVKFKTMIWNVDTIQKTWILEVSRIGIHTPIPSSHHFIPIPIFKKFDSHSSLNNKNNKEFTVPLLQCATGVNEDSFTCRRCRIESLYKMMGICMYSIFPFPFPIDHSHSHSREKDFLRSHSHRNPMGIPDSYSPLPQIF